MWLSPKKGGSQRQPSDCGQLPVGGLAVKSYLPCCDTILTEAFCGDRSWQQSLHGKRCTLLDVLNDHNLCATSQLGFCYACMWVCMGGEFLGGELPRGTDIQQCRSEHFATSATRSSCSHKIDSTSFSTKKKLSKKSPKSLFGYLTVSTVMITSHQPFSSDPWLALIQEQV